MLWLAAYCSVPFSTVTPSAVISAANVVPPAHIQPRDIAIPETILLNLLSFLYISLQPSLTINYRFAIKSISYILFYHPFIAHFSKLFINKTAASFIFTVSLPNQKKLYLVLLPPKYNFLTSVTLPANKNKTICTSQIISHSVLQPVHRRFSEFWIRQGPDFRSLPFVPLREYCRHIALFHSCETVPDSHRLSF